MKTALSLAAIILAISGFIVLFSGSLFAGAVLIVLACLVGPGGYSLANR